MNVFTNCEQCGKALAAGARFCGGCGAAVADSGSGKAEPAEEQTSELMPGGIASTFGEQPQRQEVANATPAPPPPRPEDEHEDEDEPDESGSARRGLRLALLTIFALLIAGGSAVAVVTLVDRGPSDTTIALNELEGDRRTLSRLVDELKGADRVDDLVEVGEEARGALPALQASRGELRALEDERVRRIAMGASDEIIRIVTGWNKLTTLDEADLMPWTEEADGILTASNALRDGAAAEVDTLAQTSERSAIDIPHEAVREATLSAARYLRDAHRTLEDWRADRRRYRRETEDARAAASSYRDQVEAILGRYDGTRDDMQRYIDAVKDSNESIGAFLGEMEASRQERTNIRSQLIALSTTAPRSVRPDHGQLVGLLDAAVSAVDTAIELADTISFYREFGDDETSAFELPEYDSFQESSDSITDQFGPAISSWRSAIGDYIEKLGENPPPRPVV